MSYYKEGLKAEKAVLEPNHDPHIMVTLTNIAQIHKQHGNYVAAVRKYREVHNMMQVRISGPNHIDIAATLSSMGLMKYQMKEYSTTFKLYQEALCIHRDHLGESHADVASSNSIGLVLFKQEHFDVAKQCFMESLRIRCKILGTNHRDVAIIWYNIASTIFLEIGEDTKTNGLVVKWNTRVARL